VAAAWPRLYRSETDRDHDFNGAVADPSVVEEAWYSGLRAPMRSGVSKAVGSAVPASSVTAEPTRAPGESLMPLSTLAKAHVDGSVVRQPAVKALQDLDYPSCSRAGPAISEACIVGFSHAPPS
jgi:hypothetical protein